MKRGGWCGLFATALLIGLFANTSFTTTNYAQNTSSFLDRISYIGTYRLVATTLEPAAQSTGAAFSPGMDFAGMNASGTHIAWTSFDRNRGDTTVYWSDFNGTSIVSKALDPALGRLSEFEVANGVAFFIAGDRSVWAFESGANVRPMLEPSPEFPAVAALEATEDGGWLYFLVSQGANQNDVYALPGQGTPQLIVDDKKLPCPAIRGCKAVWGVYDLTVSGDGGAVGLRIGGFYVENEAKDVIQVDHDELLVLAGGAFRYITDGLPVGSIVLYPVISPNGGTLVFSAEVLEGGTDRGVRYWIAAPTDGSGGMQPLLEESMNLNTPALTRDGALALLDLSAVVATDGIGRLDLFPSWNITSIHLAATRCLAVDNTGQRVAFMSGYEAFYVGSINDRSGAGGSPIQITDVRLTPGTPSVLTIATAGPVDKLTVHEVHDGVLRAQDLSAIWNCWGGLRDDGQTPDQMPGDGVYSMHCEQRSEEPMSFRIGASTRDQGWVMVVDVPLEVAVGLDMAG